MKIIFENYPRQVELSKARRKKFYEKGKALPKAKKYQDKSKYEFRKLRNGKTYLFNKETDEVVIANPKASGTPKIWTINGQAIWSGMLHPNVRAKVARILHEYFNKKVKNLKKITKFPILINVTVIDDITSEGQLFDLDNRVLLYNKTFIDTLTENKIIPDDNVTFITEINCKFVPLKEGEVRKLIYEIK